MAEIPGSMLAAVYEGNQTVVVRQIPTPQIGHGELLVRVESCGICHTDLKKIQYDLLPGPRIYGHETAGVVVAVGAGVKRFQPGDRIVAFHHIPCLDCFYCHRKLYAQCPTYKRVGITAGFEPAGGGFAQYVRVMDWIVERGVELIPAHVTFDEAAFVEPVNTCLKAVRLLNPQPGDTAAVLGQGPIGLIFTRLLARAGCSVFVTDTIDSRRKLALSFGAQQAWDPQNPQLKESILLQTEGRGCDIVVIAASAPGIIEQGVRLSRPGAKILLFSQTSEKERIEVSGADICVGERVLVGSYSASVDLQREAAELVFSGAIPVQQLITHRIPLDQIQSGIELAVRPNRESLKIIVQPQRLS
jgi:L-iditol 2-dehydrogenase